MRRPSWSGQAVKTALYFLIVLSVCFAPRPLKAGICDYSPTNQVDIMVLYTDQAVTGVGGLANAYAYMDNYLYRLNQTLRNSGTGIQIREVARKQVTYTESGLGLTDLSRLRFFDGFIDEIHTWRDAYGADLVTMFVDSADNSYGYQSPGLDFTGFSVVLLGTISPYVFAHEIGHNLGMDHSGSYVTPDSYSTLELLGFLAIPYYSNQVATFAGDPVGSPSFDTAATINAYKASVEAYRPQGSINAAPTVSLTTPASGAIYNAMDAVTMNATASDSDGSIYQVDFYIDEMKLATVFFPPYQLTWGPLPAGSHLLRVEAVDDLHARASSSVSIMVNPTLPLGWDEGEVYEPGIICFYKPGSSGQAAGIFRASGTGGAGSTHDQHHFSYQTLCGDGSISAYVDNLQSASSVGRAGLMIRDDLNSVGTYIFSGPSLSSGYGFVSSWRATANTGGTFITSGNKIKGWFKLERVGSSFTAYTSINGSTWNVFNGPISIPMTDPVYMGFMSESEGGTALSQALSADFTNMALTGSLNCASPTPSQTPNSSVTPTVMSSPSASPSVSPTHSITQTHTLTPTQTQSPSSTLTPTRTHSPTVTPSDTRTASPTQSPSSTRSPTHTESPTGTASDTRTDSPTRSPTATLSGTPTASPTRSASSTPSSTGTPSPTRTLSFTPSPTPGESPSFTQSPADSPTPSPSATQTSTPLPSSSPSPTLSVTPTLTALVSAAGGTEAPQLVSVQLVPNPIASGPGLLAVKLEGNAERFQMRLFSPGYTVVAEKTYETAAPPGWVYLPVDPTAWPQSLLYLRLTAEGHGGKSSKITKILVLR